MDINENVESHNEEKLRLIAEVKCYFDLIPLFKSKILWKMKITLYKVLVKPIALNICGA